MNLSCLKSYGKGTKVIISVSYIYIKFFFAVYRSTDAYGLGLLKNPMFFREDGNQRKFPIKNSFKKVFSKVLIVLMDFSCFKALHKIGTKSARRNDHRFLY